MIAPVIAVMPFSRLQHCGVSHADAKDFPAAPQGSFTLGVGLGSFADVCLTLPHAFRQFPAAEQVKVQVSYRLTAILANVGDDAVAV